MLVASFRSIVRDSESGDGEGNAEEGHDQRGLRDTGQVLSVWP